MNISEKTTVQVADTFAFLLLAKDSHGRNRGPSKELLEMLDPDGVHVVAFSMIHNDVEMRHMWICKLTSKEAGVQVWMDNSFEAINQYTQEMDVPVGGG